MAATRRQVLNAIGGAGAATVVATIAAPMVWAQSQPVLPIKFTLNLPRNGSNAAFFLGVERGYFRAEGLEVQLDPASGADAMTRVASETHQVGFNDLTSLIEFNARNRDSAPIAVFNVFNKSSASIVSFKKSGIAKPADLKGKTLGGPATDNAFRLFPIFAKLSGLGPNDVAFKNVDLRLRETLFLRGEFDAITGFDSTVWFNLKAQGVKIEDISIMLYADFGMDTYSTSVSVSRAFLRDHADRIPGLVRACNKSWRDALADPAAAGAAVAKVDPLVDRALETDRAAWILDRQVRVPEVKRLGLGAIDRDRLAKTIDLSVEANQLPVKPTIDDLYTDRFLPPLADRSVS